MPEEKAISLEVCQAYLQDTPGVYESHASLVCADDLLASPRHWTLRSTILDGNLALVPQTEINQSGVIHGRTLHLTYAGKSVLGELPEQTTCNWSLWDSIQRLPRAKMPPVKFALFEELDLLKLGHRIDYCGLLEKVINGKRVSWHRFQHVGRGLLPYHYYLDQQGRLLAAIGGERAYIYDPEAPRQNKLINFFVVLEGHSSSSRRGKKQA